MNSVFIKHALTFGKDGEKWLDQIPETIKRYEAKWSLKVLYPYNLTYNYIAPVVRNDGSKAVLKIGFPKDREFQTEIEALSVFNGGGSVNLLKADRKNAVILIEQVNPGTPLSTIQDDTKATRILASVMKKLWKPLPKNNNFITIYDWIKALLDYPKRCKSNHNHPVPLHITEKATQLFRELIATSSPPVLTHADLHHDNILRSNRDQWLAIDPKGIAAEPAYDTAAMIRNPYKMIKDLQNIDTLLYDRIMVLSQVLGIDPKRIHKWCFAQTVLSGVWTIDDASDTIHALKVAESLDRINICT